MQVYKMTNQITLTNTNLSTSTAVKLLNSKFTYNWKNLTKFDPGAGYYGSVETQFSGWENPALNLQFYIPIDNTPSGSMTWSLWNEFVKYEYDGETPTILNFTVGGSDTAFTDYSASGGSMTSYMGDADIPVQIKSYSLVISPDTRNGYMWVINAQLQVTK